MGVLIVVDIEADTGQLVRALTATGCDLGPAKAVHDAGNLRAALLQKEWRLIVCAADRDGLDGRDVLTLIREHNPSAPIIVVLSVLDAERVVDLIRRGATNVVGKNDLDRFHQAVRQALAAAASPVSTAGGLASGSRASDTPAVDVLQALAESEERVRALIDHVADAVFLHDTLGTITYVNAQACKSLGYAAEELIGRNLADIAVSIDPQRTFESLHCLLRGESPLVESVHRRKDGSTFPVEVRVVRFIWNGEPSILASCRDVSERHRAEAALRSDEELLRGTFEQAAVGLAHVGLDGRWLRVNDKLCAIVGYSRDELLAKTVMEMTHPEDLLAHRVDLRRLLGGEIPTYSIEKRYLRRDGSPVWVDLTVSLIRDPNGQPKHFLSIFIDATNRKEAEIALQASEERFALAVRGSNDGIWDWNLETNQLYRSPRWMEILGLSEEGGETSDVADLLASIHPDDREYVAARLTAHLVGDTPHYESEHRLLHADGTYRWVLVRGVCRRRANGIPYRMAGANSDLTGRKRIEQALQEAQTSLQVAISATGVGFWEWDLRTGKISYSDSWFSLFGYKATDFDGSAEVWMQLVHPEDAGRLIARTRVIVDNPSDRYEGEFRMRHRDGTYGWTLGRATVLCDGDGVPVRMLGANVDISRRKRAEEAARRNARQLRAVFEATGDTIGIQDGDGTFLDISPSIRSLLGYEPSDLVGRSPFDFVHPDDVGAVREAFVARLAARATQPPVEMRLRRADGSWVYVECTLHNLLDDPDVRGIVTTTRDITERRQAAATHVLRAREEESARIAREIHDQLGQGLTALRMDAAWLDARLGAMGGRAETIAMLQRVRTMDRLIESNIASVRRIATELRPPILDDLGLVPTIEWQAEEFEARSGIRCEFRTWPSIAVPDPARSTVVLRVLQEALTNVARHAEATRVVIHLRAADGFLCLDVRDNGRGIGKDEIDKLNSLGIKSMRDRAAYVGGEIAFSGAPGRGTTVTLRVPE